MSKYRLVHPEVEKVKPRGAIDCINDGLWIAYKTSPGSKIAILSSLDKLGGKYGFISNGNGPCFIGTTRLSSCQLAAESGRKVYAATTLTELEQVLR